VQEAIGERLKIARIRKKLTLKDLSEKCGLSKSFLSQIERGEVSPSLGSLMKVAGSLDMSLLTLFSEDYKNTSGGPNDSRFYFPTSETEGCVSQCAFVKKTGRKSLTQPGSQIKYSMITPDLNRKIQILHTIAEPGQDSGEAEFVHQGEECCLVIQGQIEIRVGSEVFSLEEGDSLYFPSSLPHRWQNPGTKRLETIWVITPPSF
jgi:transcriptional regulator with XRE-family HTH domain